ncbi:Protein GDAP2-like [Papilio xuthus]|uniref:Protein GDAP2-like n=1 Tax=Papilio xuthus TaxID=66420 RepID=A0A194QIS2_PAPXU|nr:Protein GDAP2-like [Papilio xuthus]
MRAPSGVVRWSQSGGAPLTDYAAVSPAPAASPPPLQYIYDERINQRLAFWQGDITALDVDAVTNTTDETLSECNAVSERIMHAAGPELKEEIITSAFVLECGTGEVVVTPGYQLRSRHVLHTVCPNYLPQYHTAAETSLHNCYKNVLSAACEVGARSLALCVVSTPRRNFPPDLAAHVALSTIRRYLETSAVPGVVVVCACGVELSPLRALAPLYFPRSAREALAAAARLPPPRADLHDRRIRIIHNPHSNSDSGQCANSHYNTTYMYINITNQTFVI